MAAAASMHSDDSALAGFLIQPASPLDHILVIAQKLAREAGKVMLDRSIDFGDLGIESKSSSKDLVTKIDKKCQDVIENGI